MKHQVEFERYAKGRRRGLRKLLVVACVLFAVCGLYCVATRLNLSPGTSVGDVVDSFNGVSVHHNGGISASSGRNLTPDGYNIGIRYQCVEFVKRYYNERFSHRMPDTYGHAKDFFERGLADGTPNSRRGLLQFVNGGTHAPAAEDIIVLAPWIFNRYGHVAIVSAVSGDALEVVQQNPGPFGKTRKTYRLSTRDGRWQVENGRVLGWLRLRGVQ